MTDWLNATAFLLCGVIVGFMFVYANARRKERQAANSSGNDITPANAARETELRDLEAKRDAIVRQLRELGDDQEQERERLEVEAANTLRALDAMAAVPDATFPVDPAAPRVVTATMRPAAQRAGEKRAALQGFLWGAGSMAALAAIGFFVMQSAKPRGANDTVTGQAGFNAPMTSTATSTGQQAMAQAPPAPPDAALKQLMAAVDKNPNDVEARDLLAKAYLDRDNLMAVYEQTQVVLQKAPNDPRALAYQGLVRLSMGQLAAGQKMLESSVTADPTLVESRVGLAWVYTQQGKGSEAAQEIKEAIRQHPDEEARLNDVLAQMRSRTMQEGAAQEGAPEAPFAQGGAAPQQADASAAASGPALHITLNVANPSRIPAGAVLFVFARSAGVTSGPPAAVKRLPVGSSWPMSVELSAADSMMGQPLPAKIRLEARIDSDGNPVTHEATDLSAAKDNVAAGDTIALSLQ